MRKFEKGVEVIGHAADAIIVGDRFFQALAGLHHLLTLFGLIPKVGRRDLFFGFG
jgi:hypothetical protein